MGESQPGLESGWKTIFCFSHVQASFGAQAARLWRMTMDPIVWLLVIDPTLRKTVYWLDGFSFLPMYIRWASLMLQHSSKIILARPSMTKISVYLLRITTESKLVPWRILIMTYSNPSRLCRLLHDHFFLSVWWSYTIIKHVLLLVNYPLWDYTNVSQTRCPWHSSDIGVCNEVKTLEPMTFMV